MSITHSCFDVTMAGTIHDPGQRIPHSILHVMKVCLRQWSVRSVFLNNLSLYAESSAKELIDLPSPGNTNLLFLGSFFILRITFSCQIGSSI
jgi:hypothetical protein